MPAKSEAQRKLMAIAEHNPSAVSAKNRGVLGMSHDQLHDFAATKGAPAGHAKKNKPAKAQGEAHSYDFRRQRGRRAPARISK